MSGTWQVIAIHYLYIISILATYMYSRKLKQNSEWHMYQIGVQLVHFLHMLTVLCHPKNGPVTLFGTDVLMVSVLKINTVDLNGHHQIVFSRYGNSYRPLEILLSKLLQKLCHWFMWDLNYLILNYFNVKNSLQKALSLLNLPKMEVST